MIFLYPNNLDQTHSWYYLNIYRIFFLTFDLNPTSIYVNIVLVGLYFYSLLPNMDMDVHWTA